MTARDLKNERIVVLCGGTSCEREVSLVSGAAVEKALKEKGYTARIIDPAVPDFMQELKNGKFSVAFIALHGTFGEDGTIQTLLEDEGIPYTGSGPVASRNAFDKAATQAILSKSGIKIPEYRIYSRLEDALSAQDSRQDSVVKPTKAGSSCGVTILRDPSDYETACREAFKFSDQILVESYIEGRELTVAVLGDRTLPIIEVRPARRFYDYQAKYQDQGTIYECPATISPKDVAQVNTAALQAYQALGCEVMGRADLILTAGGQAYVLEVNTIPGLTGKSLLPKAAAAIGMDFTALCESILELSLNRIAKMRTSVL